MWSVCFTYLNNVLSKKDVAVNSEVYSENVLR